MIITNDTKPMETLIIHSEKNKIEAIKALLLAFDVKFKGATDSTYSADFINKIKESETDLKESHFRKVSLDDLWK